MKAVMKVALGVGNIELREINEPETLAGQVKIKVHSAGLCGTDLHIYKDEFRSWPPVVLGHEASGVVQEAEFLLGNLDTVAAVGVHQPDVVAAAAITRE